MLIRIAVRLLVLAAAIWLTTWLLPDVILGPILHLLALPITAITLGLFALVVNAALVGITAALSSDFSIDGFFTAVLADLLISVFSWAMNLLVR